ncbi:hypothetical protein BH09BAC1_BH09BAC1_00720 [soil metagenome]
MNFLSHYYLDRHHPSAYFKLGLVIPDLVRGYNKYMRKAVAAYQPQTAEHRALQAGLGKHRETDRIFHTLPEFDYLQEEIKSQLKIHGLLPKLPRYWFLAHIAVEMLIDRNLMKQSPRLHVEFYNDLATVSQPLVENYFDQIACKPMASEFFDNFNVFKERRFLQYYPSDTHFTEALLMAWYRATGNKVEANVRLKTQQALLEFERQHADLLASIPEIVAQQFKIVT